jgi:hypothetical protein
MAAVGVLAAAGPVAAASAAITPPKVLPGPTRRNPWPPEHASPAGNLAGRDGFATGTAAAPGGWPAGPAAAPAGWAIGTGALGLPLPSSFAPPLLP